MMLTKLEISETYSDGSGMEKSVQMDRDRLSEHKGVVIFYRGAEVLVPFAEFDWLMQALERVRKELVLNG